MDFGFFIIKMDFLKKVNKISKSNIKLKYQINKILKSNIKLKYQINKLI